MKTNSQIKLIERVEQIDVTLGGIFDPICREYCTGKKHYYVSENGVEKKITKEDYDKLRETLSK